MILIAPCERPLRNGDINPRSYPYWKELAQLLGDEVIQVGEKEDKQYVPDFRVLNLKQIEELIKECETYWTIDSFFQHYAWSIGKKGIVIFSKSDPLIFGHKENTNILKDRKYLRPDQFNTWEGVPYEEEAFQKPNEIIKILQK
jgi:ADP-heptose:LPS heptosyltransferase